MTPEAGDDPYAPPLAYTLPQVPVPVAETGEILWRVEGGKLLVRVGAVLPEVCVFEGKEQVTCVRTGLAFKPSSLRPTFVPAPGVVAFQSRRSLAKCLCKLIGGPVLATIAGLASSLIMTGNGSATIASVLVSFALMAIGVAVPIWQLRKMPEIDPVAVDGWHEVRNVHPAALERLRSLQAGLVPIGQSLGIDR